MTEQIGAQFNDDGVQIELDPSYHISAISDAYEAYLTAEDNNKENLFSPTYLAQLETPAKFTMDITYPNFSTEDFNDTRSSTWSKSVLQKNFRKYVAMFPNNTDFQYMASGKGMAPDYLMASYPTSGYYVLRSGWEETDAMLILKITTIRVNHGTANLTMVHSAYTTTGIISSRMPECMHIAAVVVQLMHKLRCITHLPYKVKIY